MDLSILLWIQENMRNDFLDFIFMSITKLGDIGLIWILITLFLLIRKDTRYVGVVMLVSLILSAVFTSLVLKPLFARPRPFETHPLSLLIPPPHGTSFPSGHTATSFAVAWAYFIIKKDKLRFIFLLLAVTISFSRLYLFVHYPTDVLTSIGIGIAVGYLSKWFVDLLFKNKKWGIYP